MNRFFLWGVFLCASVSVGQSQEIRRLSSQQAVEVAIRTAVELRNLQLDVQIQEYNNKEILSSVYPQVSASGQATYYTNLPKIQFPTSDISVYKVLEKEGVLDRNGQPIDISQASFGVQPVSFVAPFNMQVGLGVNQLLFQPDVFIAVQARQSVLDFAKQNVAVAELKVKESVLKAYYAVLVAEAQKTVLFETRNRLQRLMKEMSMMYSTGFAEKLDIDKLQVTLNNTETALNQLNNGIQISIVLLKNTMGIPQQDSIVLTEKLDLTAIQADYLTISGQPDYQNRPEFTLLGTARKLQELDMKRYQLGYLPTVAAFYQLQRSGQRNESFDVNGSGPWFWFTAGLVGLSVNQPIFDGFQKKYKVSQAKLKLQKIDNSLEQLKGFIDLEQGIAVRSYQNAIMNLDVQTRNVSLAKQVFETTNKKYQAGTGSSFELLQTDTEYQRANGSYFQAMYDAAIARISYLKSIGKL
ncbi:MAG: TolC family protein [Saprospiraceae bacterium]|jgi:outer membrane protein|nr:TolC family protein [Saprospiraceae bacterium]